MTKPIISLLFCLILSSPKIFANAPKVGRNAAAKYFSNDRSVAQNQDGDAQKMATDTIETLSNDTRFLMFGLSSYVGTDSYKWGQDYQKNVGKWGVDMTYRLGAVKNAFDEALRVSYTEYELAAPDLEVKRASKMSFMYTLILPDAGTHFPLYFGLGFGPGVFLKQLPDESPLALDYQLFFGLRLFNLFENTGFYIEAGMKNHLQLTTDGQVNGNYLGAGGIFTF
jgi:hypothetical protein